MAPDPRRAIRLHKRQRRVPKAWRVLINAPPGTCMGGQYTLDGKFIKREIVNGRPGSHWRPSTSPKKVVFASSKVWRRT